MFISSFKPITPQEETLNEKVGYGIDNHLDAKIGAIGIYNKIQICDKNDITIEKLIEKKFSIVTSVSITGAGASIGIAVSGALFTFLFPPLGVIILITGVVSTTILVTITMNDVSNEEIIQQLLKLNPKLTYEQVRSLVNEGDSALRDSMNRTLRFKIENNLIMN